MKSTSKFLFTLVFSSLALAGCGGGSTTSAADPNTPPALVDLGNGNVTLVTGDSSENCDTTAS